MKNTLITLFLLIPALAFAQRPNTKVDIGAAPTKEPLLERLNKVGIPVTYRLTSYAASSSALSGISANTIISTTSLETLTPAGSVPYLTTVRIYVNRATWLRPQWNPLTALVNSTSAYGVTQSDADILIPKNGFVDLPYNASNFHSSLQLRFTKYLDADTSKLEVRGTLFGYEVSGGNIYADNQVAVIGTSIDRGTGATQGYQGLHTPYTQQLLSWLLQKTKKDWGIINKSVSGGTSLMALNQMASDWQRAPDVKIVIINHGTNDVSAGVNATTFTAQVVSLVNKSRIYYPNALILVLAPIPSGVTATETTLVSYRTSLATAIPAIGDSNVKYIAGTGSAWNPAVEVAGTYVNTIDGTHPNPAGNILIYTTLVANLTTNNITIPTN